jgi:hypothetical protein
MPRGRRSGRNAGRWTKTFCLVGGVFALAAGPAVGNARADDATPAEALAANAQTEIAAAVDTAGSVSSTTLAAVHPAAPEFTTMDATTTAVASSTAAVAAAVATAPDTRNVEPAPSQARAVEHRARPRPVEPRKRRPRALPQVRGRPTGQHAPAAPIPVQFTARPARVLRPASGTPARSRPKRRSPAPTRPAPLAPPTRTPDNPGVSWSGQNGGQGAFPTPLPAAIAGFLILAISFGLLRVIWWARPVPIRVAATPWKPG